MRCGFRVSWRLRCNAQQQQQQQQQQRLRPPSRRLAVPCESWEGSRGADGLCRLSRRELSDLTSLKTLAVQISSYVSETVYQVRVQLVHVRTNISYQKAKKVGGISRKRREKGRRARATTRLPNDAYPKGAALYPRYQLHQVPAVSCDTEKSTSCKDDLAIIEH